MKKVSGISGTVAAVFALSSFALSAFTLSSVALAAPASPPIFTWQGFYAGVHVGYGWGNGKFGIAPGTNWIGDPDLAGVTAAATRNANISGALGGVQAGYNYQSGKLVFGVEVDASALGVRGNFQSATFNGVVAGSTYSSGGSLGSNWLVTVRPRIGVAMDRALFYVTGGLAIADNRFNHHIDFLNTQFLCDGDCVRLPLTPAGGGSGTNAASKTKTIASWTLGAGVEYAVTDKISLKAEYLYVNLGKSSAVSTYIDPNLAPWRITHKESKNLNIVRVGLNFLFN